MTSIDWPTRIEAVARSGSTLAVRALLDEFARAVRGAEREACAQLCDDIADEANNDLSIRLTGGAAAPVLDHLRGNAEGVENCAMLIRRREGRSPLTRTGCDASAIQPVAVYTAITEDRILSLAVGCFSDSHSSGVACGAIVDAIRTAVAEAVAAERASCAMVCNQIAHQLRGDGGKFSNDADRCTDAILARGAA